MKKINLFLIFISICVILLSGCSPAATAIPNVQKSMSDSAGSAAQVAPAAVAPEAPSPETESSVNGSTTAATGNSDFKRIVIKEATLSIVVKDPATSLDVIGKMSESMGGFIVSSNIYKSTTSDGIEVPQAEINIRVPAEKLTEAINTIKSQVSDPATGVTIERVTGSDVTKEYTDLQSRLKNLESAADQLRDIMSKAYKTEDVMSVYNQLMQVNEQLEVIKGQIKYYDEASNLSQISVTLQSEESVKPLTVGGWKPEGIARDAVQALITTLQVLGNIAIWLVLYFLPLILVLAIVVVMIVFIIRAIIKAFKRPKKPQTPPGE
jgi:hypothetical protein